MFTTSSAAPQNHRVLFSVLRELLLGLWAQQVRFCESRPRHRTFVQDALDNAFGNACFDEQRGESF
ncbi:MAG: hypothetical protein GY822_31415 [Deltaproteobacteria bacterium]|nr:hypothetical protein [Deltaproteobacteria bacterium]